MPYDSAVPSRLQTLVELTAKLGNPLKLDLQNQPNEAELLRSISQVLAAPTVTSGQTTAATKVDVRLLPSFGAFGDSRTRQGHSTDNKLIRSIGYQYWAMLELGANGVFLPENNFGVNGDTTQLMLARMAPVLASQTDAMVVLVGTNNWGAGISLSQTIADYTSIISQLRAAGKVVFVICELPRGDTANTARRLASNYLAYHNALRQWLLGQRYTRGVYPVDVYADLVDPSSATGDAQVGLFYDGLHESMFGARIIGRGLAAAIKTVFPQLAQDLAVSNADLYDAVNNPYGSLLANPMLAGITGTKSTGTTGDVATSWGIPALPTNISCVASKITDAAGKVWQQLVFSGTPTAATAFDIFRQDILAANFGANDGVYATAEVQVDVGGANYGALGFDNRFTGAFTTQIYGMGDGDPTIPVYNGAWNGFLTTPVNKLPNAVPASARTRFYLTPISGAALSLSLRIRAVSSRKVRPTS